MTSEPLRADLAIDPATATATATAGPLGQLAIGDIATYPGKRKRIPAGFAAAALADRAIFPLLHPGEALHFEYSPTRGIPAAS